jgi:hypothetical protein
MTETSSTTFNSDRPGVPSRALWPGRIMSALPVLFLLMDAGMKLAKPRFAVEATHARVGDPTFSHVLFPTYLGALLWGGLCLRDPRLRVLLPWRTRAGKA